MKKKLKNLGLVWLTALTLGWGIQEGIWKTTQETDKNIQGVFAETKDWKGGEKTKTYVATAADFQKNKIDSLDATQVISLLNDTISKLVESYGKEWLNEKIHEINKEYPDFQNLPEGKQKEIVMKEFVNKKSVSDYIVDFMVIMVIIGLSWKLARVTSGKWKFI